MQLVSGLIEFRPPALIRQANWTHTESSFQFPNHFVLQEIDLCFNIWANFILNRSFHPFGCHLQFN